MLTRRQSKAISDFEMEVLDGIHRYIARKSQ